MSEKVQVLVIGGGPGGATTAGLLARQGLQVTLLENSAFPRYHIGESILPSVLPILDLLGAREAVEDHGFVRKDGAYCERSQLLAELLCLVVQTLGNSFRTDFLPE